MGMIGNSLAQGLISGANIQDGTVDTPDIKDSAVTAAKIASAVVTPAKLSTGAPTWDTSSNVGVGVTPSGWSSAWKAAQIGPSGSVSNNGTGTPVTAVSNNAYYDGTSWVYLNTAAAAQYQLSTSQHIWRYAASGSGNITWSEAMRLDTSGRLGIGTSTPSSKLTVDGTITSLAGGQGFSSAPTTTTNAAYMTFANGAGTSYIGIDDSAGNAFGAAYATFLIGGGSRPLLLGANGSEKARIDSNGNLGLGVTPNTWYLNTSVYKALQFGSSSLFFGNTTASASNVTLYANSYLDTSAVNRYLYSNYATKYGQTNGTHVWSTAASGTAGTSFTFTDVMTLDASGNLGIATTSPSSRLDVRTASTNSATVATFSRSDAAVSATIYYDGSDGCMSYGTTTNHPIAFRTNNTERARIDSSGSFLVGTTTSDSYKAVIYGAGVPSGGTTSSLLTLRASTNSYLNFVAANEGGTPWQRLISTDGLQFWTSSAERARIDLSGNLLVGVTSAYGSGGCLAGTFGSAGAVSTNAKAVLWGQYSSSSGLPQYCGNWQSTSSWGIGPHSGSNDSTLRVGVISVTSSGASWTGGYVNIYAGAYTNASDYRIKENVTDVEDGVLAKILALRPVNYNIIPIPDEDGDTPPQKDEVGFLAHEIQEHLPVIVNGEKDAVDGAGNAQHQGVDYAKLSAYLVKAMQEQQAIIESLTERITALETQ